MAGRIPVIFSIDVEPDAREPMGAEASAVAGADWVMRHAAEARDMLARAGGAEAAFSWFFRADPQIEHVYGDPAWLLRRYAEAAKAGDAVGLHTHAWRWDEGERRWISDHGDQEWIERCVRTSFDVFRAVRGRGAELFRFGDGWINAATLDLLESLGVRIDLTLEPGHGAADTLTGEKMTGRIPDRRGFSLEPFLWRGDNRFTDLLIERSGPSGVGGESPSPSPDKSPDASSERAAPRLWVVPISTATVTLGGERPGDMKRTSGLWRSLLRLCGRGRAMFNAATRSPAGRFLLRWPLTGELTGRLRRAFYRSTRSSLVVTLNLVTDPEFFAAALAGLETRSPRYLAVVCRSGDLALPLHVRNFRRNVALLAALAQRRGLVFTTPEGLLKELGLA